MQTQIKKVRGVKVPILRFSDFSSDWGEEKLGKVCIKVGSGSTPLGGERVYKKFGIPFIRSQNVVDDKLNINDVAYISDEVNQQMNGSIVSPQDVLLNITGASIGRSCVVPTSFKVGNVNQHVCIIRLDDFHSPYFVQHFLSSYKGQKAILRTQVGGGREGLNFQGVRSLKLFFPSLLEQEKIASFLVAVDEKIEGLSRKKESLERYKKGVMQKIFLQEIRFKDENGNSYPDWEEKSLRNIFDERNDKAAKSDQYPLMAFVAYKGVTNKGERYNREFLVSDSDNKSYKQTEYGDFIYSSNNLETGSIGLNYYGPASISPVYSIFQIKKLCDYRFISNFFTRRSFINKMVRYRQGVVYGQWRIKESDFLKIKETVPSLGEQQKISDFLTILDEKISAVGNELSAAKEFKKGLLQQMFV